MTQEDGGKGRRAQGAACPDDAGRRGQRAQGTGLRAQSKGHRAQLARMTQEDGGTEHRAQSQRNLGNKSKNI